MKKTTALCLASLGLLGIGNAFAQMPTHPQYVKPWDEKTESFDINYRYWEPGQVFSRQHADDEEFFISRVRPRTRFVDAETQVKKEMSTERKFLWWVPIGVSKWNAIPSYYFNSEVFSTWSYIDHWGNWTAPYLRIPGAFTDAAHKNGVSVSATATIPFGDTVDLQNSQFTHTVRRGVDKYLQYLRYYGIDGAGYNSEFNFLDQYQAIDFYDFLSRVSEQAKAENFHNYSNVWYSLTNSVGRYSGSNWDSLNSGNVRTFQMNGKVVSTHFFLNYNWYQNHLNTSKQIAEGVNRSTYDVYAGINMQGGSNLRWSLLRDNPFSIGIWGAHNANMIYENRGGAGSNPLDQQKAYQLASEYIFTGGKHNPIDHYELGTTLPVSASAAQRFFGFSKMIVARSSMTGNLDNDPFVSYLNLGNGRFFNIEGQTQYSGEWYNLGMQDFMPTWRWWFSSKFMGREVSDIPAQPLKAEFTWSDAWFGGSCLELSGQTTAPQYLQLFKTKYQIKHGDKLTIRYKVVSGSGKLSVTAAQQGKDGEKLAEIFNSVDQDRLGEWQVKEINIGTAFRDLRLDNESILSLLGLRFEGTTADFTMRLGEVSLTRGTYATPNAPTIKKSLTLQNSYQGHDFKIIYSMADLKADKTTTYNDEVNTWYFKIYSQQEGEQEEFCTATTSWAAYVVNAKLNVDGIRRVRFGVSAVSMDGKNESPITWTEYTNLNTAEVINTISADYSTINVGEEVRIKFDDPKHADAQAWVIKKGDNEVKNASGGTSITFIPTEEGVYDAICTLANGTQVSSPGIFTVVPRSAGASPRIKTLTANGQTDAIEVEQNANVRMAYTSNASQGAVSRALRVSDRSFKIRDIYNSLGVRLGNNGSMSNGLTISFWVRMNKASVSSGEDGIRLIDIGKANEAWPRSEWSYFYLNYGGGHDNRGNARPSIDGFVWTNMSQNYYDNTAAREQFVDTNPVRLEANQWNHIAFTMGYDLSVALYVNGKKIDSRPGSSMRSSMFGPNWDLCISRFAKFGYALDGYIDELRIYNRTLSEQEIADTKNHLENPSTVENLKAYFDFENDQNEDGTFSSRVGNVKAIMQELIWIGEGNQQWVNIKDVPYGASTAFVEGNSYQITTSAKWEAKKANISGISNEATSGQANLQWANSGVYPVTLHLSNAWSEETRTYNVITVKDPASVVSPTEVVDLSVFPNPFVESMQIRFGTDGTYSLAIFDLSGNQVSRDNLTVQAGEYASVSLNAPAGIYLVRVLDTDGTLLRTIKVQKR